MTTATAATKAPKILEAISAIQAEVGTIPKNGKMDFKTTKYDFVQNDDILKVINAKMNEFNVVAKPTTLGVLYESRDLGANRTLPIVTVHLRITYISALDGSEFETEVFGEGAATDDKGLRKAYTNAQKQANLLTFSIATGEPDPDDTYFAARGATEAAAPTGPSRTQTAISNAAGDDGLKKIRAQVRAIAGALELNASGINQQAKDLGLGKEYTESVTDLQKVYEALVARAEAAQA